MPSRPPKPALVRADQLLVDQGLAATREQARALILAGAVRSGTARIEKPGQQLRENIALAVAQRPKYVSRGGDKLEGALNAFRPDARGPLKVRGITVLDIGSSTGGFTDCLLQRGAAKSYAVDVGTAQLAEKLRQDPRVVSLERTNVRHGIDLPEQVDLIVADVSFIS
ncbi:MAG: SAM-dependent methyltransferase, partial [Dehalococcoidia bacterium]